MPIAGAKGYVIVVLSPLRVGRSQADDRDHLPANLMIERIHPYPPLQREQYRNCILYRRWKKRYRGTRLFEEVSAVERTTGQLPVKWPPPKHIFGFGELFLGIHYLNCGYKVMLDHWGRRWKAPSYLDALQILGKEAANLICQSHPQPPDLFVVDQQNRFFFVEVKLLGDKLNEKQILFFKKIERYLDKNMPKNRRAPCMAEGHWIELVRLKPEQRT